MIQNCLGSRDEPNGTLPAEHLLGDIFAGEDVPILLAEEYVRVRLVCSDGHFALNCLFIV